MKNISIKIFVLILSTLGINSNGQTSEDYFKKGNSKYTLKDYKGAIEDYNKAIELNPKNGDIYYNRGIAKAYSGDNKGAIKDYKRAAKKGSQYSDTAYYMMGWAETKNSSVANMGGKAYTVTGHSSACKHFTKAIEINPKYVDAYFQRGQSRMMLNKYDDAIEDFTKVIELNSKLAAVAYYYRGNCKYAHRGLSLTSYRDTDGACTDWSKAVSLGEDVAKNKINRFCK